MAVSRPSSSSTSRLGRLKALQLTNERAKELRPEGMRLLGEVQNYYNIVATLEKDTNNNELPALKKGVEAFEEFLKWRANALRALGRPVEQGKDNAMDQGHLGHVMQLGSELRFRLARTESHGLNIRLESHGIDISRPILRETEAVEEQWLLFLGEARHTVDQAWTALGEHDESVGLNPPFEPTLDKFGMAFNFATIADASRIWHTEFGSDMIEEAEQTSLDGDTLRAAHDGLKEASLAANQALTRIGDHSENPGQMPRSRSDFARVPDLQDEIKNLRCASHAVWLHMDRITQHLIPRPDSDAVSASGFSPTGKQVELAIHMNTAVKNFATAFANFANVLEELLPSSGLAGEQKSHDKAVQDQVRKKQPPASAVSTTSSAPDATTKQRGPVTPSSSATRTRQNDVNKVIATADGPTRTTENDLNKATADVNNLIGRFDRLENIHEELRSLHYSYVHPDLRKLSTDVGKELKHLNKLIDRAEQPELANLKILQELLNRKVMTLHGKSNGWHAYIESLRFDAFKLFELPQTSQWAELSAADEIHAVGPAVMLPGRGGEFDGKLFEIKLQAKRCSNDVPPGPVFLHVHLNEPSKKIEPYNVTDAHLKNRHQVNLGRTWQLNEELEGRKGEVHRASVNRSSEFFTGMLSRLEYSVDNARDRFGAVRHVPAAEQAKSKGKGKAR